MAMRLKDRFNMETKTVKEQQHDILCWMSRRKLQ